MLITAKARVNAQDANGRTALHEAARGGHSDALGVLIAAGADVNKNDEQDILSLNEAIKVGNAQAVSMLLDAGAKVNYSSRILGTPLTQFITIVVQKSHSKDGCQCIIILKKLLEKGAKTSDIRVPLLGFLKQRTHDPEPIHIVAALHLLANAK